MLTTNNYRDIVLNKTPIIDVRSPNEYLKGYFYNAVNLPLMNDEERHLVGLCYKEKGSLPAVELGYKLVSGHERKERIAQWVKQIKNHPDTLICCSRGGLRSQITQEWIKDEIGLEIPYIEGGFKAFRNYLIDNLNPEVIKSNPIIITGNTGAGKTNLLINFNNFINLEKLANHRGSSFGHYLTPQPQQITFENNLAYELIHHQNQQFKYLLLEDEGRNIGKSYLPRPLVDFFRTGELIILDVPLQERVQNTLQEYVISSQKDYLIYDKVNGIKLWYENISDSIDKIQKRLGKEKHKRIKMELELAYNKQISNNDYSYHTNWIEIILKEYYDPMYNYQIKNTSRKIIFKGNFMETYQFIENNYHK
ncbi:MAG TPA: tRNA 2-selenouridine(34) synthase MnmH [Haloplasmataceae bacterium]